ncbi:hypothetical protein ACTXOF_04435 [Glutamicibacter arilaitensis]|uniref:hypothetical protein n=1 Tax=Glutamicibacter arilaitensis TaxID=256701 RepID=UPI003FD10874
MSKTSKGLARAADPATSHAAAAKAAPRAATIRERVRLILEAAGRGMTHDEIISEYRRQASRLGWSPASDSGIRTRVHELVERGIVERSETGAGRSRYGRATILWRAVSVQNDEAVTL